MRVLIVTADPPMYRRGLAAVLEADPSFVYLGESVDGTEAVRDGLLHKPDVILIDSSLAVQPQASGRSLIAELRSLMLARFVLLHDSVQPAISASQQAQALGAGDVLGKNASAPQLVDVLHRAFRATAPEPRQPRGPGAPTADGSTAPGRRAMAIGEDLTRRESELLALMARGLGNFDIATRLAITVPTVKFHVTNVLSKLHADNRTAAVLTALRQKIVTLA
ncbi:MAG: response regulator transcription factor [Rubrivivax sp.]|nr:response regulator transcription factor [Rubrivivax sp.]